MKTLIINKCMERNSGDFYAIEDFKISKRRSGVGQAANRRQPELYDSDTVLCSRKVERRTASRKEVRADKRW
jgi:hypothetical protein